MTGFYKSFRDEIAAGGAVEDDGSPTRNGRVMGLVMLAGLVALAVISPWTFVFVLGCSCACSSTRSGTSGPRGSPA